MQQKISNSLKINVLKKIEIEKMVVLLRIFVSIGKWRTAQRDIEKKIIMFTHIDYINRGINMPYYLALEAGYITLEEYNDLKKIQSSKTKHTEFIEYSQSELDDMYKDAFDGNEDAYWNID